MTAVIARVVADDAEEIDALMGRCSVRTRYGRFFTPVRALPAEYRAELLARDPARHDAVVARVAAVSSCRVVGLASLAGGPDLSELGVLVEDGWQRRGLGTAMVEALVARARARRVRYLRATVLPTASRLLVGLAGRLPLESSEPTDYGVTAVYRLL